jgi:hypothetical protein
MTHFRDIIGSDDFSAAYPHSQAITLQHLDLNGKYCPFWSETMYGSLRRVLVSSILTC